MGKSKADQVNNTAFPGSPLETDLLYTEQIQKMVDLTERINASMQLKLCLENQEADCGPPQVLCRKPEVVECTGSGCGSGVEESYSGLGDVEEGDQPEEDDRTEFENQNRPNSYTQDPSMISTSFIDPIVITDPNLNSTDDNTTDLEVDYIADTDPTSTDDSVTNPIVIIGDSEADDFEFTSNTENHKSNSPSVHPFHHLLWVSISFALYLL